MVKVVQFVQEGLLVPGVGTVLYLSTVSAAALVALGARSARRRRDARAVLALLLRRPPGKSDAGESGG